jgi:hypothetical protein
LKQIQNPNLKCSKLPSMKGKGHFVLSFYSHSTFDVERSMLDVHSFPCVLRYANNRSRGISATATVTFGVFVLVHKRVLTPALRRAAGSQTPLLPTAFKTFFDGGVGQTTLFSCSGV